MIEKSKSFLTAISNILSGMWGVVFLVFPLLFVTLTTEVFIFPKQILLAFVTLLSLIIFGIRTIGEKKVTFIQTFLDLPIFLFILSLVLSTIFSVDRINSIIFFIPLLLLGIAYFIITNTIKTEQLAFFFVSSLLFSGALTALLAIFSFLKTYVFPFAFTHVAYFTPFGNLLDQAIYLTALLPLALYFAYPLVRGKSTGRAITFAIVSLLLISGITLSVYQLFTTQKPIILPFATGFQIAFAAISHDSLRLAQGFFLGSGPGTFFTSFARFKQPVFNGYEHLWFLNFTQSTSFILELLTTTGLLGLLSFLFIMAKALGKPLKTLDNPLFFSLCILALAAFIFPFSYTLLALFFFLLSLFSVTEGFKNPEKSFDLELSLVALKKNLFHINEDTPHHKPNRILPVIFVSTIIIFISFVSFYSIKYILADMLFNQSLAAANANNGALTYEKQKDAIDTFPYRDGFYRIFSQTNLSLANSLLIANQQNKENNENSQTQQTALNLIQQSISFGRMAVTLAPVNTLNWQNLATIYRDLINVGQNADKFAIDTMQKAIILDPSNPQEYISLGGIYYQLGQYENAIKQFQYAVNLKPDFANAYYNLGHAYEASGDKEKALENYKIVRSLIANDKTNLDKINSEIHALAKKTDLGAEKQETSTQIQNQEGLNINKSTTQLPKQPTPIKLPPEKSITKTPTPTP